MTGEGFPAAVYADTVLRHNFQDAQRYFLDALIEIHYAHAAMLARQGIISPEAAGACIRGLDALDGDELRTATYDGRFEDLFFFVESRLEALAGEDAGRLHTARSRNDLCIALYRMRARAEALRMGRAAADLRVALLELARRHAGTFMPAFTHTQPAQPTTLGHYLMAYVEVLGRDMTRLEAAFATVNRSPLGACAITTTGFPIDREYIAGLLGFEGLQLNSYGAIAATDYLTELAGAVATAMVNLGRFTQDLLLWCNPALGFLRLSDAWVQISSIMPQKRNPVPLEHTRILASRALAEAQGVFTCLHNTPFGDINDSEDDIQPLVFTMAENAHRALRLLAGVTSGFEFDTARMRAAAGADFLTTTELADTLVREGGLSFREAHHVVSGAVRKLNGRCAADGMASEVAKCVALPRERLLAALDPEGFVQVRTIAGGPGALGPAFEIAEAECRADAGWIERKSRLLADYPAKLRAECLRLTPAPDSAPPPRKASQTRRAQTSAKRPRRS